MTRSKQDVASLRWATRPFLVAAALRLGWLHPTAAALAIRQAWLVHVAFPSAYMARMAARSWQQSDNKALPRADALLVLCTQHLLSQGTLHSIAALLIAGE